MTHEPALAIKALSGVMKQSLKTYVEKNFDPDSVPCKATLYAMCEDGRIPGAYQDTKKRWWVDLSASKLTNAANEAIEALPPELRSAAKI